MVRASVQTIVAVIEQMPGLPWVEDDDADWIDWEIDGMEGQSNWFLHLLRLGSTSDPAQANELVEVTRAFIEAADRHWGAHERLTVAGFNDSEDVPWELYDRREGVIRLLQDVGTNRALWWKYGANAVLLAANPETKPKVRRAAVMVLPVHWIETPDRGKAMRQSPVVADLLSGEVERVRKVALAVRTTRDREIFEPLAAALPALETSTYAGVDVDAAFDRIRIFAAGTCLCADYLNRQLYNPETEAAAGHVRIVEERQKQLGARPERLCECSDCGRRFHVEEGDYHYTWWRWTELED